MTENKENSEAEHCIFRCLLRLYPRYTSGQYSMHIMEELPSGHGYCIALGVVCLPFLVKGFTIRGLFQENRRQSLCIAMAGAYIFVLSTPNSPPSQGSCFPYDRNRHLERNPFGPGTISILGIIVLLLGGSACAWGLTTLRTNTFFPGDCRTVSLLMEFICSTEM